VSERCAEPGRIWAAVDGALPASEARSLVLHSIDCPACEAAWRLAREMRAGAVPAPANVLRSPGVVRGGRWRWAAGAVAAVVVLGLFPVWLAIHRRDEPPLFRDEAAGGIRSLVPEEDLQPRVHCLLRWSPGPPGTRYNIQVALADLRPVASASALDRAEYLVPEAALQALTPGTRIFWRVESLLPDGGRQISTTFVARVE